MRENKFRIWDDKRKEWVHGPGNEINLLGETIIMGEILRRPNDTSVRLEELNDLIVLQFTGLCDKEGKEIYEGDVLYDRDCFGIITGGDESPDLRVVQWNADEAKFELAFIQQNKYDFKPSGRFLCKNNSDTYFVFGNLYSSPDLLNQKL